MGVRQKHAHLAFTFLAPGPWPSGAQAPNFTSSLVNNLWIGARLCPHFGKYIVNQPSAFRR